MNKESMKETAAKMLSCQTGRLEEKEIPAQNAMYYRDVDRGGGALIVSNDGTMLLVDPFFVNYDEHLQKFINGERSCIK